MKELLETLASEIERPRELSAQVVKYLSGTYSTEYDAIGSFLVEELPKLEDYEIDLILSPLFTPKLSDQAIFAGLLGRDAVPRDQWPPLIQKLVQRPIRAQLVTSDGRTHSVLLREVTLERYVHRLRLEGSISDPIFALLNRRSPSDQPLLKAIARRAVWEESGRRNILERYLANTIERDSYRLTDVLSLLNVVENYKPVDTSDLLARIPKWQEALRQQIDGGFGPKPFFMDRVAELHGGDRDQRRPEDARLGAKEKELTFLVHLEQVLAV